MVSAAARRTMDKVRAKHKAAKTLSLEIEKKYVRKGLLFSIRVNGVLFDADLQTDKLDPLWVKDLLDVVSNTMGLNLEYSEVTIPD